MKDIRWGLVIGNTAWLAIVPWILQFVAANVYALYIGFQTRGDTQVIQQRLGELNQSGILTGIVLVIIALLAFWRSRAIARSEPEQLNLQLGALSVAVLLVDVLVCVALGRTIIIALIAAVLTAAVLYGSNMLNRRPESNPA